MGVAYVSSGTGSAGTTVLSPTCPATVAAGTYLLLQVSNKYPNNGPATPSGWTPLGQAQGGQGASGAGSGLVYKTVYGRIADGSEGGTTVTVNIASGNVGYARIHKFSKLTNTTWETPAVASGSDNSAGTAWSVVMGALEMKALDLLAIFSAANSGARTFSAEAVTASGLTFANETERTDQNTGLGDGCTAIASTHDVATGAATTAPTYTMTASGTLMNEPAGCSLAVRLREFWSMSGTGPLVGLGGSGAVAEQFSLSGTGALSGLGGVGSEEEDFILSGAGALSGLLGVGAAQEGFSAAGSGALAGLGGAGVAEQDFVMSGAGALSGLGGSGSSGSASAGGGGPAASLGRRVFRLPWEHEDLFSD